MFLFLNKPIKQYYKLITDLTSYTNLDDLSWDPAEWKKIVNYHLKQRDEIGPKYLSRTQISF